MFVASGVGPFVRPVGAFPPIRAGERFPTRINRYTYESAAPLRSFSIARLAKQKYVVGDSYTIVDMALWGWARLVPNALGEEDWAKFPNLKRLVDEISARPAAARANELRGKHKFKTEFDEEARNAMFRHMTVKVA